MKNACTQLEERLEADYLDLVRAMDVCIRWDIPWSQVTQPGHDEDVLGFCPDRARVLMGMYDD